MTRSKHTPTAHGDADSQSDVSLIRAALSHDEEAWRELVQRFGPLVYSIPSRYGMDESGCEDVFQEVFTALFARLAELRDVQSLPKWLITTTHRITWRMIQQEKRTLPLEYAEATAEEPPQEFAERWERQHVVRQALLKLDQRCRSLLTALHGASGTPNYESIARTLNMPKGSIGPTRGRCLERLLQILQTMDFKP